jgi:hypothetical protein
MTPTSTLTRGPGLNSAEPGPWGGDPPLNFLAIGGVSVGNEDVGYGPARAFRAAEVAEIAAALEALSALRSALGAVTARGYGMVITIW